MNHSNLHKTASYICFTYKCHTDLGSLIGNFDFENSKVWDFCNFPVTLLLREINFAEFRVPKTAVSTILETLNFDFWKNVTLKNVKSSKNSNSELLKWSKWQFLGLQK